MGVADKAADGSDACAVVSSVLIATHDVLHALELSAILLASHHVLPTKLCSTNITKNSVTLCVLTQIKHLRQHRPNHSLSSLCQALPCQPLYLPPLRTRASPLNDPCRIRSQRGGVL